MPRVLEFLAACWTITLELAPWLLLGALAGGLLHVLVPAGWLNRQLRGPWGVVKSVLLGVPLPLCSCGVIPVGLSLRKSGASSGAAVGFLISTPQTGVDSVLVSATMLGWPFAVFKLAAAAVTGVVGGWLADAVDDTPSGFALPIAQDEPPAPRSLGEVLSYAQMLLKSLWRWLVLGVVASALIGVLLPPNALSGLSAGGGAVWGDLAAMLLTLVISVPLYVCATASVPIAASLVAGGLPTGAALVFLMAGPATNLATIGAVRKALGGRALAVYLGVIIAGSVAAGLLFEAVIPAAAVTEMLHHQHQNWWSAASAVVLLALVGKFAAEELAAWRRAKQPLPASDSGQSIGVDGMTCGGCVAKLERTLRADSDIQQASVTLSPGRAVVEGPVTAARLAELVRAAGFTPR
ncbi:copper exporting ATPase [Posidoniimonas polymericola]|uniref:Copper exporting ATPase n=1 Tax=Posidoniimonas polymericola TaxID=2528002 RepID=A0A5C5ZF57_9BACT|nr:permease [Posidoniimonas polymericola]TWT85735.1 copper exporting ATPase [Posidoniimonas polymericola]